MAEFRPLHCPVIWRFCCSCTFSWLVGDWRSVFGKPSPQCRLVYKSEPVYSTGRAWIFKLTANKQPSLPSGFQLNANDIQSTVTVSSSRVNEVFVCQANERILSTGGRCAGLKGCFWMKNASRFQRWSACCNEVLLRMKPQQQDNGSTGPFRGFWLRIITFTHKPDDPQRNQATAPTFLK